MVILLLRTESSVTNSCMSIRVYRTVVNIEIYLLQKIITEYCGKIQNDSQTKRLQARKAIVEVHISVLSAQLSRVGDTGCWLLLSSTAVSITICFRVFTRLFLSN